MAPAHATPRHAWPHPAAARRHARVQGHRGQRFPDLPQARLRPARLRQAGYPAWKKGPSAVAARGERPGRHTGHTQSHPLRQKRTGEAEAPLRSPRSPIRASWAWSRRSGSVWATLRRTFYFMKSSPNADAVLAVSASLSKPPGLLAPLPCSLILLPASNRQVHASRVEGSKSARCRVPRYHMTLPSPARAAVRVGASEWVATLWTWPTCRRAARGAAWRGPRVLVST